MKTTFTLIMIAFLFVACKQETRYTQASPEIDSYKALIADYESGNWDGFASHYAENAYVFRNSNDSISVQESIEINKESLEGFSSYGFVVDDGDTEMVVTDKGETWVNFWGTWKGTMTANNKEFSIPVHITANFVDGKILKSYGYWDNAPIAMAQMELDAAKEESEASLVED